MRICAVQEGERVCGRKRHMMETVAKLCPCVLRKGSAGDIVAFVGIALSEDAVVVSFPKGFNITAALQSDEVLRKAALLMIRAIAKYKADNPLEAAKDDALDGTLGSQMLYYAFQILDDYFSNGLISRTRSIVSQSSGGNVVWQRTISRSAALHFSDGVLYQKPYTRARIVNSKDVLRLIQQHVVKDCFRLIGWLFNAAEPQELQGPSLNWNHEDLLAELTREKAVTYSQREIKIIDLMDGYLRESSTRQGSSRVSLFGSLHFELIWEDACKVAFCSLAQLQKKLVPQPRWHRNSSLNGFSYDMHARQIPDILAMHESILLVVDAKYYNTSVSLPGWHDIVKQIYYQDTIERRLSCDTELKRMLGVTATANAFLFPGEVVDGVHLAGDVSIPAIDDGNRWGCIDAYHVDVSACLTAYVNGLPRKDWVSLIGARYRQLNL